MKLTVVAAISKSFRRRCPTAVAVNDLFRTRGELFSKSGPFWREK